MARLGIDISEHQGNIDLQTLKNNGVEFAIIRVGYGTKCTIDSKFNRNADLCRQIGLPVGFYWYSYALDIDGARREALAFVNAIEPYKDICKFGAWIDMEDADGYKSRNGMPSNQTLREICAIFCKVVEDSGFYSGIYASQSWFNNQLNGDEIKPYDKWVAQWPTSSNSQKGLSVDPNSRTDVSLWQFTSVGKFDGYNGNLDTNYAYYEFPNPGGNTTSRSKSIYELAQEVINDEWGTNDTNPTRKERLESAGYDYSAIQAIVNELMKKPSEPQRIAQNAVFTSSTNGLRVRRAPSLSGEIVAHYDKGESVRYDSYIDNEGYRWISYIGSSGNRNYVARRKLDNSQIFGTCK